MLANHIPTNNRKLHCMVLRHVFWLDSSFLDLGAGIGVAAIAAALVANFSVIAGVEISEPLYDISNSVLDKYKTHVSVPINHVRN